MDRVNSNTRILGNTRLVAQVERLERSDSFQASKKVCNLLQEGVLGIFGPQSVETSAHIQSTCEILNMPHLETRFDYRLIPANHSTNLFPQPRSLGAAFRDLLKQKSWKSIAILYEEDAALVRVQEILKDPEIRLKNIVVQQFNTDEYRKVFKEIGKIGISNIVLDVPKEHVQTVLRHAQQVDMLSEYHNYVFTCLDLATLDLEDFQYSGTNISAFSLIDSNAAEYMDVIRDWNQSPSTGIQMPSREITMANRNSPANNPNWQPDDTAYKSVQNFTTEVALMYDAVMLFATALADLQRSKPIAMQQLSCETEDQWAYGWAITNYMKMITIRGITGDVKFDENGFRSDFQLRLTELTREGIRAVGDWTPGRGVVFMQNYTKAMAEGYRANLRNKTLIVVTSIQKPYTMYVPSFEKLGLQGNDRYEGYCVDLIKEISVYLGFKYTLKLVPDGKHGGINAQGEWNGMIRELVDKKADIAVADLTITYERESAVDFSMPFMNLGIGILYRKPQKEPPKLFSFMSPLAIEVWIYLLTAFLGVTLFLFVIARFSPYEWVNPHPCVREPEELENSFTMKNTLWFTIGCLMQQGCDIMPRALSTRVLAASWWFFILILVSSYTANLAAFLTVERMVNPIESAEDLAKQTKIKYGSVKSGSTEAFFRNSNHSTYARMWSFMESDRPSVFVDTNQKGVERVKKGDYAFLMESTSIEYLMERECDLYQVGGLLDLKSYGIATVAESPYRALLSDAILYLQEKGMLYTLKNKWWSEKYGGGSCGPKEGAQKAQGAASELGLANVGGVFVVLAAGSAVAIVICILEFVWKMKQVPRSERDHIFVELVRELKHVICCYGSTRPVRKTIDDMACPVQTHPGNGMPFMPLPGYGPGNDFLPNAMAKEGYS